MPAVAWTATLKTMPCNQVACTNALNRERRLDTRTLSSPMCGWSWVARLGFETQFVTPGTL